MTPFTRIERNVVTGMLQRQALLAHPCDFFRGFFNGRVPTVAEKLLFVEEAVQRMTAGDLYQNDTYTVEIVPGQPFIHLDIRRIDGEQCKNWRHFQQIKDELVGPEHEAVELFPAESRLVDTANQYHLWVVADPAYRFPFGFANRFVLRDPIKLEANEAGAFRTTFAEPVPYDSVAMAS